MPQAAGKNYFQAKNTVGKKPTLDISVGYSSVGRKMPKKVKKVVGEK